MDTIEGLSVSVYLGSDGVPVVQIDTEEGLPKDRIRVNFNDNTVADQGIEHKCDYLAIHNRLEELRADLRAENISYGELIELQSLAPHIPPEDVELLEAAGVPEFDED